MFMCFMYECSWEHFKTLRDNVQYVSFKMLLRRANAVVYIKYTDNIFHKFCKQASKSYVGVFRIFDSINYIKKLKLGVDAAGSVSGFVERTLSHTVDVLDPNKGKCNIYFRNRWTCTLTRYWENSILTYNSNTSSLG